MGLNYSWIGGIIAEAIRVLTEVRKKRLNGSSFRQSFMKEEKYMKKKLLSILLAGAMTAAMLAGCGSPSSAPAEPDAAEQSTEAAASAVAPSESSGAKR